MESKKAVKVSLEGEVPKGLSLTAYGVDRAGRVVGKQEVKGGTLELDRLKKARKIYIAPTLPDRKDEAPLTASKLKRLNAYELSPSLSEVTINPARIWPWPPFCLCLVRGTVSRAITAGDVTQNYPVCNARVHICEVDRWLYVVEKIRPEILRRVRDDLIGPRPLTDIEVRPVPLIPRPPIPDPPPFRHAGSHEEKVTVSRPIADTKQQLDEKALVQAREAVKGMPADVRLAFATESTTQLRQAFVRYADWILPLICWWPWFWYDCEEVAVVDTDHNGEFTAVFAHLCSDTPDLYVWVEYNLNGTWETVYHPPIRCSTIWNFDCGTQTIDIVITDPRVPVCAPPPPDEDIVVFSIGNSVNVSDINTTTGLINGAPFGGSLEPHVEFGQNVRSQNVAGGAQKRFYRWSYRRLTPTPDALWTVVDTPVYRQYLITKAVGAPELRSYQLGPVAHPVAAIGNVFLVPPLNPPVDFDATSQVWAFSGNARANTASAFWLTPQLSGGDAEDAEGIYELKLEVFDETGAPVGDVYVPVAGETAPFVSPTLTGPVALPLIYRLRIDNIPAESDINPLETAPPIGADEDCGFYTYPGSSNPTVGISFVAKHDYNFATFGFDIRRGTTPVVAVGGQVGNSVSPFAFTGGTFLYEWTPDPTVSTLLGPCPSAAFAARLNVNVMATDGWNRLSHLDAPQRIMAFALAEA